MAVVVFSAHPDDEILGLGGVLRRHVESGEDVYSYIFCEGSSIRYGVEHTHEEETQRAASIIGASSTSSLGYPDQKLDEMPIIELTSRVEQLLSLHKPRIVYTHWAGDLNRDHQYVCEAVMTATRLMESPLCEIRQFYTVSSSEWSISKSFKPDLFVDITSQIEAKIEALREYKSEMRDFPHPRSIENVLANARVWGSICCMKYAEAFVTARRVIR